jgi:hypothetical protein
MAYKEKGPTKAKNEGKVVKIKAIDPQIFFCKNQKIAQGIREP